MSSSAYGRYLYAKYGRNITLDEPDNRTGLVQRRKNSTPDIYSDTI